MPDPPKYGPGADTPESATLEMGMGAGGTTHWAYASAARAPSDIGRDADEDIEEESAATRKGGADVSAEGGAKRPGGAPPEDALAMRSSPATASEALAGATRERLQVEAGAVKDSLVAAEARLARRLRSAAILSEMGADLSLRSALRSAAAAATRAREDAEKLCYEVERDAEKRRPRHQADLRFLAAAVEKTDERQRVLVEAEATDGPEKGILLRHAARLLEKLENEGTVKTRDAIKARVEDYKILEANVESTALALMDARVREGQAHVLAYE